MLDKCLNADFFQISTVLLYCSVESTALRLITGLGSSEVAYQLSRIHSENKSLHHIVGDSEELNRALVLTIARALEVISAGVVL